LNAAPAVGDLRDEVSEHCTEREDEARGGTLEAPCVESAYRKDGARIIRYFARHAPEDAGDLAQEAFLSLTRISPSSPIRNPQALLQRIARNILFNHVKQMGRWRRLFSDGSGANEPSTPATQDHGIEADDLMDIYRRALDQLPERTRMIFLRHRIEEQSYAQIATDLGVSVKAIEYHIASALKHLRKTLDGE
jgi:RNA polymerase sigma-70 factor (ECF subfamily)